MNIKLVVLIYFIKEVALLQTNYCEICVNHTLCKYMYPVPSRSCIEYDTSALLTERDIQDILNRINNRRNFIAMKNLKYLPGAANMRKMEWSLQLALIAQRWADQCDPSILPDRQDQCRNTDNFEVGQNIASISGLANGVNVKSFIDMWFIESLNYIGSMSSYNQSRDYKTNYFTQLIWAETEKVGCGRVRFYANNLRTTLIDRLVCNFAPKGNVHGKPVYVIGNPATRCPHNMVADFEFSGLCAFKPEKKNNTSQKNMQDFYPKKINSSNTLKSTRSNMCDLSEAECKLEFKKIRDEKNSYAAVKRSHTGSYDDWIEQKASKNIKYHQQEKGHSRVQYNHNHKLELDSIHPNTNQNWGKYDALVSSMSPLLIQDYGIHQTEGKCTRKHGEYGDNVSMDTKFCEEKSNQCTRGQKKLCQSTTSSIVQNVCQCNRQIITCAPAPVSNYEKTCYSKMLKSLGFSRSNNMAKRKKVLAGSVRDLPKEYEDIAYFKQRDPTENSSPFMSFTTNHVLLDNINDFEQNYSERLRRQTEDSNTFKPFWQIDEFVGNKQLKSIRYTTLANRKNKKYTKPKTFETKTARTTEFITISKETPIKEKSLTEKYLSFDELLHLRKFNKNNRRYGEYSGYKENSVQDGFPEFTEKPIARAENTTSSVYTANTPFIRMRHCTRKLTCTWTAALLTDSGGSPRIVNGNGRNTPPGYVEGCTRTSTCTREFMHRNKMATLSTELPQTTETNANDDDEDYCERRSLNKRDIFKVISKRNIDTKNITKSNTHHQSKRNYRNIKNRKGQDEIISYGDLYYLVVHRLVESWKNSKNLLPNKKCLCSSSNKIDYCIYLFIFVTAYYIFDNKLA